MASFSALTQPGRIGNLTLKNRMVVMAMGVNLAEDGYCGERIRAYHERQAAGGAGLIIMGVAGVAWPSGGNQPGQIAISDDRFIPGLAAVADAVHAQGGKLATQLHHGGLVATEDSREGRPMWVPSYPVVKKGSFHEDFLPEELATMFSPDLPKPQLHVMTVEDIHWLTGQFADAAARARQAGIDGIEIHAGHGYILSEFLSPCTNQRDDEYGGSLANRARFLLEVIAAVRDRVGDDYPVWCKIDAGEFGNEEGITLADARATAAMIQSAGADAITVSAYHDTSQGYLHSESNIPHTPERLVSGATAIKQALHIPVITSGRIEPEAADRHIASGNFDFFGMGRKILADPALPGKIVAGQPELIRPCVYCYCCVSQIYVRDGVKCAVNPETARETERTLIRTDRSRHFAVIGGGPGGMEFARRMSQAGHRVTLLERAGRLGGTLQFASIAYRPNEKLLHWLRLQIERSSVEVKLNCEATPQLLKALGADEVIVATGAARTMPDIAGNEQDFVFSGDEMRAMVLAENAPSLAAKTSVITRTLTRAAKFTGISARPTWLREASRLYLPLGKRIGIIGSELVGLELAEFLAERGREVTVVDTAKKPGKGLYIVRRMRLLNELKHLGVALQNNAQDIAIGDHSIDYVNYRGQSRRIEVDQVIVAKGATGNLALADALRAAGLSVHTIGDCNGVGYIEGAIESAAELAVQFAGPARQTAQPADAAGQAPPVETVESIA